VKLVYHVNLFFVCSLLSTFHISAQSEFERLAKRYSCSNENKNAVLEYFVGYERQQKQIADSLKKLRDYQTAKFGRILPQISGRCEFGNNGCPISLVKPFYSSEAKQRSIFRQQRVETIIDEKGNVIYARIENSKSFLAQAARQAACRSKFMPLLIDNKPCKFQASIVYNFILN
jgi:hypothetical protein